MTVSYNLLQWMKNQEMWHCVRTLRITYVLLCIYGLLFDFAGQINEYRSKCFVFPFLILCLFLMIDWSFVTHADFDLLR